MSLFDAIKQLEKLLFGKNIGTPSQYQIDIMRAVSKTSGVAIVHDSGLAVRLLGATVARYSETIAKRIEAFGFRIKSVTIKTGCAVIVFI